MAAIRFERWLPLVSKPSRYIDHELNAAHKPWQEVNFCLCYPDVYEVGVSHLGLKILYSILNSLPGVSADRCYLPWLDMLEIMRREGIPPFGLESRRELRDFDLIGITLQSELTYTNILELLDLAGLPVFARDRQETDPVVLAGGPCAANPLPLAPFIDAFFIGEAEEAIQSIAEIFLNCRKRPERLAKLAEVEGCFVPALHLDEIPQGWKVRTRKFAGFAQSSLIHAPQLQSWQLATHNRCVAEIMRGCSRGCRFCHAGYFYRPVRERSASLILQDLLREIRSTGWDEAGLLSLSSSDYGCLKELLCALLAALDTDKTHISLPSLRVDALDTETVELMRRLGREGLTIAPEAGSQRLRDAINKNLSEVQILDGVQIARRLGWQKLKLYFMLGLPTETDADIDGIIDLIGKIASSGGKRLQVNVTLSPFVPKPGTPFQWAEMLPAEELLRRCLRVKQAFARARQVKIKYHTIENSLLEAAFSRGDLRMGGVLLQAWQLGARFDGWNECFDFRIWEQAFQQSGVSLREFLAARDPDAELPWDFVETGVSRDFLKAEWNKAQQALTTPDCRAVCASCGVCDVVSLAKATTDAGLAPDTSLDHQTPVSQTFQPNPSQAQHRYRIHYAKTGMLRFISHLDWMRMLFRLIANAPLDTVFTQGFSPHPRVSLCPPLPLGVESACEFCDVSYYSRHTEEELISALSQAQIPEFHVLNCESLAGKAGIPAGEWIAVEVSDALRPLVERQLAAFAQETEHIFTKSTETRSKDYDLKRIVQEVKWNGNSLLIQKSLASPALYDVLTELLRLDKITLYTLTISRRGWVF